VVGGAIFNPNMEEADDDEEEGVVENAKDVENVNVGLKEGS